MKNRKESLEQAFDPILAEVYRVRDAYSRKFKFDTNAICDALLVVRPSRAKKQPRPGAASRALPV
ncbi:MAG: hypothetical protein EXR27_19880 [Betaproteobacteria bacterium]|nr:hypothetical protein [Betaproteobacteria bacterium]